MNVANDDGRTALDAAKRLRFESVVAFLTEHGAVPGKPERPARRRGDQPLNPFPAFLHFRLRPRGRASVRCRAFVPSVRPCVRAFVPSSFVPSCLGFLRCPVSPIVTVSHG